MATEDDDNIAILQQYCKLGQSERLQNTDLANARRFIQQDHNDVRWIPERSWLAWVRSYDGRPQRSESHGFSNS